MEIKFTEVANIGASEAQVILVEETLRTAKNINSSPAQESLVNQLLTKSQHLFTGKFAEIRSLTHVDDQQRIKYLIVVGIGSEQDLSEVKLENIGGKIVQEAQKLSISSVAIGIDFNLNNFSAADVAVLIARGAALRSYQFNQYITDEARIEKLTSLKRLSVGTSDIYALDQRYEHEVAAIVAGVSLARNCATMPANLLNPDTYAEIINEQFADEALGVKVTILEEAELRALGAGALLGVGQGSKYQSRLAILEYNGSSNVDDRPLAFVGKGVTFDTGGICIKPSDGMWQMKYDMSGSAAVLGLVKTLALRKAKVNVVGLLGIVENILDNQAQRPGDVVKTMSGKTVEVGDTDAEGRLVLADAMWYAQEKFNPSLLIDIATLTGAIRVALGPVYAGLFANNDELAQRLSHSGAKSGENVWRMPLHQRYEEMMESQIADICNISINHRSSAGSCTAANFLQCFVQSGTPWAHIDIAGVGWNHTNDDNCPKGAAAFGVRLFERLIRDYYEK